MSFDPNELEVVHNEAAKRFEVAVEGELALIQYIRAGERIVFTHTEVPEALEGQGIAKRMAYIALEYAKAEGLRVQPLCPFMARYIREHPEYQSITTPY